MQHFISDLHLEESRPDITGAFFYFIDQIESQTEALYILGDFFEAWIGDDENTPLQQQVKQRLKAFTESGPQLFVMHGNRDFLIGEQFAQETGAQLLPDPSLIHLAGEPILLMHGDSLCTRDHQYMKFRQMIRNPGFLETFLQRPLAERQKTAQQLRAMSATNNQDKSQEIMDVTPEEVEREMLAHDVRIMIHGHTHRPKVHDLTLNQQAAQRYVLGDWDSHIWFIEADDSGMIELKKQDFPD